MEVVSRHFEPFGAEKLSTNAMNPLFPRAALLFATLTPFSTPATHAQNLPKALCEDGQCAPAIATLQYGGRRAYKLTDGKTQAVIVPDIGRVMSYGRVGGPNLLWNLAGSPGKEGWKNYGGDKTWLAPQSSWKAFHGKNSWPPDEAFDGKPHRAEVLSGGKVRMVSPLSPTGIRLTRTMYFADNGDFVIEQMARKERGAPVRASIWSVTQTVPGEAVFLPRDERSTYSNGFAPMGKLTDSQKIEQVTPKLLRVATFNRGGGSKIGVDAPVSSIASVRDGVAFVQKSPKPRGVYPDAEGGAGFPVELYVSGEAANFYLEMELLGPLKNFSVGGKSTHTMRWSLHDLPSKNVDSPAVVSAMEKLLFAQ